MVKENEEGCLSSSAEFMGHVTYTQHVRHYLHERRLLSAALEFHLDTLSLNLWVISAKALLSPEILFFLLS